MSSRNILFIFQTGGEISDDETSTFVIEDELETMDQEQFEELYSTFANYHPQTDLSVPLYRIFWQRSAAFENGVRLLHQVYLYRRLSNRVRECEADRLQYNELDDKYKSLIHDVADVHGTDVVSNSQYMWQMSAFTNRGSAVLESLLVSVMFFLDQILSFIMRPFLTRPRDIETAFVPVRSHFDRMEPVVSEFDGNYELIIPTVTVKWIRERSQYPDLESRDPTPINMLSTPRDLATELSLMLTEIWPVILRGRLDEALETGLQDELGVAMPRCVSTEINTWLSSRSFTVSCLVYQLSYNIIDRTGCESLIVGSAGPKGKSVMAAGDSDEARVFHVRHSVVTGYTPEPPFDSLEFVEGQVAMTHLQNAPHVSSVNNFIPTGFQYLADSYDTRRTEYDPEIPVNVLVATQPYEDDTRLTFLNRVMEATAAMSADVDLTIKIHPRESTALYDIHTPADVSVVDQDLSTHLREAELVFTINSNVGLEAMLVGTPCVCLNEFEPMIQTMPYAEHGPVPVLRSSDAVEAYFDSFGCDSLRSLSEQQQNDIEDRFILEQGAGRRMAFCVSQR